MEPTNTSDGAPMIQAPIAGLPPVARQTTTDRVVETMRAYIDDGFEPGARLPSERALCQTLGVGRTTLREALRVLQSEGRLTVRAGSGAYVAVPGEGAPFARWPEQLDVTVEELLQVRLVLEPIAAALAAVAPGTKAAKRGSLDAPLAQMERAMGDGPLEQRVASDLAFHMAVARLAGNNVLLSVLQQLGALLVESRRVSLSYGQRLVRVQSAHEHVRDAILAGDADAAARAMASHLAAFGFDMGLGAAQVVLPTAGATQTTIAELLGPERTADDVDGPPQERG